MKARVGRLGFRLLPVVLLLLTGACSGEAAVQTPPPVLSASPSEGQPGVETRLPAQTGAAGTTAPTSASVTGSPEPIPTATLFRLPSATATETRVPSTPIPTVTPTCEDGLLFIEDVTIPDGTVVASGVVVDKRWKVLNSGSCNWDGRYRLRRISGPALGIPDETALYPARSGSQMIIRLGLIAPLETGTYRSAWQAVGPQGELFGDPIYVEIIVGD